jgi:hypothetical protein
MASRHSTRSHRAFSRIDLLVILIVLAGLIALGLPILHRMRSGAWPLRDAHDIVGAHTAMLRYAQSSPDGQLPRPSRLVAGSGPVDPTFDTTANILALLIGQQLIAPETLVSRGEANPAIEPCDDYDYAAINSVAQVYWAPSVRTDLDLVDGVCHTSYAHLVLGGERQQRWSNAMDSTVPLFGDRGTHRGVRLGNAFTNSYPVAQYGRSEWRGTIVFADNHAESLTTFTPKSVQWSCGSIREVADNIFHCEFDQVDCTNGSKDGRVGGDSWLAITKAFESRPSVAEPLPVAVVERLRDGSLPK